MEQKIHDITKRNYSIELSKLTRNLVYTLIAFFVFGFIVALLMLLNRFDMENVWIPAIPLGLITLSVVSMFLLLFLNKIRFIGETIPSVKTISRASMLLIIGFLVCVNASVFTFNDIRTEWYYYSHIMVIFGLLFLIAGSSCLSLTLRNLQREGRMIISKTSLILLVLPFVSMTIMEIINTFVRKSIYLRLDVDGYAWRTALAEATKALNITLFSVVSLSFIIFCYALYSVGKKFESLDESISNQYSSRPVDTPSDRISKDSKLLSYFLLTTIISISLLLLILLLDSNLIPFEFDFSFDFQLTVILQLVIIFVTCIVLVYVYTFKFLSQLREFSRFFKDVNKTTTEASIAVGVGIVLLIFGTYAAIFAEISTELSLYVLYRVILLFGLLFITLGTYFLKRFFTYFTSRGFIPRKQTIGSQMQFYTSTAIFFILLFDTIARPIVKSVFSEITCYYDYCRVILSPEGREILNWMNFSLLIILPLLIFSFAISLSIIGENIPIIRNILTKTKIDEIYTRYPKKIMVSQKSSNIYYQQQKVVDFADKIDIKRKLITSSKHFLIVLIGGITLSILFNSIFGLASFEIELAILFSFRFFIYPSIAIVGYVFLFIFLNNLYKIMRESKAKNYSIGALVIFCVGVLLQLFAIIVYYWFGLMYLFPSTVNLVTNFLLVLALVTNFLLVALCIFLVLIFKQSYPENRTVKENLPYYGLIFASSIKFIWSLIL
ncbi:MAG: hypothetical protein KGD64_13025, partial [Candidatus Heimdallarchaeota archaeon]|nr:hypothetical protein [Candidatus Heimdallarchaeota archaeon]